MSEGAGIRAASSGIAVIGCGAWGRNLARCFARLGALAAVADHTPAHAAALGKAHGLPALSPEAVLSDAAVTAVVVAAPPAGHAALARAALAAGKHVFVEKPLTLDMPAARDLAARAKAAGRVLMTGHVLRYHPAFMALEQLVAEGRLGRLLRIHGSRLGPGAIRAQEDAMWCLAPHDVSMVLALAGAAPDRVEAWGECLLRPDIADAATLRLSFASGLGALIQVSWLHPFKEQRLTVVGDRAMAVFDDRLGWAAKLTLFPHRLDTAPTPAIAPAEPVAVPLEEAEPLLAECRHFLDCIAEGRSPRTGPEEALAVMDVLTRAATSMTAPQKEPA